MFVSEGQYFSADDGYRYFISGQGYYSIGNTESILGAGLSFQEADAQALESSRQNHPLPSAWVMELDFHRPGFNAAAKSACRCGRETVSPDGETTRDELWHPEDVRKAFAFSVASFELFGSLPGGNGGAPAIRYRTPTTAVAPAGLTPSQRIGQWMLPAAPARLNQDRLNHIVERHWWSSTAKGAGKFSANMTVSRLRGLINQATVEGKFQPNTKNRPGTFVVYDAGSVIERTTKGMQTTRIKVVITPENRVWTAYPYQLVKDMSFIVSYEFSGRFETPNEFDFVTADEMTLRYDLFLGSVTLIGGQSTITMDWEWIPILDFAVVLNEIKERLKMVELGNQQLDFTESSELLLVSKADKRIYMSTSYSEESIVVFLDDFELGVANFLRQLTTDVLKTNSKIEENAFFRDRIWPIANGRLNG